MSHTSERAANDTVVEARFKGDQVVMACTRAVAFMVDRCGKKAPVRAEMLAILSSVDFYYRRDEEGRESITIEWIESILPAGGKALSVPFSALDVTSIVIGEGTFGEVLGFVVASLVTLSTLSRRAHRIDLTLPSGDTYRLLSLDGHLDERSTSH